MKPTVRYYRVDRRQIGFIKFILEAYDNMAVVTTLNSRLAVVQVTTAPGCEKTIAGVLSGFAREFEIVPVDRPFAPADGREPSIVDKQGPAVTHERKKAPH